MGNGLLIYMMVMEDARWWNKAIRVIIIDKRHTDYLTLSNTVSCQCKSSEDSKSKPSQRVLLPEASVARGSGHEQREEARIM